MLACLAVSSSPLPNPKPPAVCFDFDDNFRPLLHRPRADDAGGEELDELGQTHNTASGSGPVIFQTYLLASYSSG